MFESVFIVHSLFAYFIILRADINMGMIMFLAKSCASNGKKMRATLVIKKDIIRKIP